MKFALVLLACAVGSMAMPPTELKAMSNEMIDYINSLGTTWKAGHNARLSKMSMNVIRKMMGVLTDPNPIQLEVVNNDHISSNDVPDEFDARTQWPQCPSIAEIRDQSNCGSCWAVAAAEAMSDRVCIASNGKEIVDISAADLMSCCKMCGQGCDGGYPPQAWQYWTKTGLVTGGNYKSQGCEPYPLAPCEHHMNASHYPVCSTDTAPTPACAKQCQSGYSTPYAQDKHFGAKAYTVGRQVDAIQKEIFANGPVEADFTVYEDFLSYTSGVYQHKTGKPLGGHAVKILGWGTEDSTPYWLIANSWNEDWGDKGYFKMIRGKNDCGIEAGINAGMPKVN
jgi:cathepsin B